MSGPASAQGRLLPGTRLQLGLTDRPGDEAELTVIVEAGTLIRRRPSRPDGQDNPLRAVSGAVLVAASVEGRCVLPGAWAWPAELESLPRLGRRPLRPADLRLPAVVLGEGDRAQLAWGETLWPLPFDGAVAIPAAARPGAHRRTELRRLVLAAAGRREDVGLTLWRSPDFEIPFHDVRLLPHARWWFDMAQVPPLPYAEIAELQGVGIRALLGRA